MTMQFRLLIKFQSIKTNERFNIQIARKSKVPVEVYVNFSSSEIRQKSYNTYSMRHKSSFNLLNFAFCILTKLLFLSRKLFNYGISEIHIFESWRLAIRRDLCNWSCRMSLRASWSSWRTCSKPVRRRASAMATLWITNERHLRGSPLSLNPSLLFPLASSSSCRLHAFFVLQQHVDKPL